MREFFIGPACEEIAFGILGSQAEDIDEFSEGRDFCGVGFGLLGKPVQTVDDVVTGDGDGLGELLAAGLGEFFLFLLDRRLHARPVVDGTGLLFGVLESGQARGFDLVAGVAGDEDQFSLRQLVGGFTAGHCLTRSWSVPGAGCARDDHRI